ncbi:MAG: hypothetical protein WCO94_00375 [Verrucomicrobiota bacterium]
MTVKILPVLCSAALAAGAITLMAESPAPANIRARGHFSDPDFFPIAVWLQSPEKARQYREAGFNTYVGLWNGPTEDQLAELRRAGMLVVCEQNATGLKHLDDPTILGWMHGDEPDNAQPLAKGAGYGPPVPPDKIIAGYHSIKGRDPSRPVLLNLGQGVAWDGYIGRGVRSNHPEDYPEYLRGCDIASFDIYPAVHDSPEIAGKLWIVARGVNRLAKWAGSGRAVWNCIECTHIENPAKKATPHQVRCEVWMSLIHGSRGLIYFVHEWKPRFSESALLDDPEMLAAVTAVNRQITRLAPVLNGPTANDRVSVVCEPGNIPVDFLAKQKDGDLYVFAAEMSGENTTATFRIGNSRGERPVEALDENRTLAVKDGVFTDKFAPWAVHLYRVAP